MRSFLNQTLVELRLRDSSVCVCVVWGGGGEGGIDFMLNYWIFWIVIANFDTERCRRIRHLFSAICSSLNQNSLYWYEIQDIFRLCNPPPPSLEGAYYLHPQTHVPYFYIMIYNVMERAL